MRSFWMLGASFFFALMAAFVKMGASHFSFFELVGYRSLFGVILIEGWILAPHRTIRTPYIFGHFKRSFIGTFSMTIWFYSMGFLPLATGLTLNYTNPIFMALFVFVMVLRRHAKIPWGLIIATIAGFAGVVLMLHPTVETGQIKPALIGLCSGFLAAFVGLQIRELAKLHEPTWRIVFYYTSFGTLWGFIGHLIAHGSFSAINMQSLLPLTGMGISATIAQLCMTQAYGVKNILVSSVLQYSAIIFATIFGYFFFGDPISLDAGLGIAIIIAAGIVATLFIKKNQAKHG